MSRSAGRPIWLKMEALQPTGSFKIRGIGLACEAQVRKGKKRLICSSGGNAGLAVAYAGKKLNVPVVVVVPCTTTERARLLIERQNATLVVEGAVWSEANKIALSMVTECDAFIHPFDDPVLWNGHASMIDEVAAAGLHPTAVVLSVGGGGLLAGVAEGLRRNGWSDVPIVAVETTGASSFAQSVKARRRIVLESIDTVATSLGAAQVCARAFELAGTWDVRCAVVSDKSAVRACERFLDDHRIVVEPACGASLSLAYDNAVELREFSSVLIIACGGVTATIDQIRSWSTQLE